MRRHLLACFVVAAAAAGCGPRSAPTVPVSGRVTLHGKPLPADATAFISFTPAGPGAKAVSARISAGAYECPEAPSGSVSVFFEITQPAGPPRRSDRTGEMVQEVRSLVPPRYATGVPITIDGGLTRDFDLTD